MKSRILAGAAAAAVIAIVGIAFVGMDIANAEEPAASAPAAPSNHTPFAGLDRLINEEGLDLGLTPEQQQAEEDFLRVMPRGEVGGVLGAGMSLTENVPYRRCEKDPYVASKAFDAASKDAYAQRMIYAYVQKKRVLNLRDCTCQGKVAPFAEVEKIIADIEVGSGDKWNRYDVGDDYFKRSLKLSDQAEAICGGEF